MDLRLHSRSFVSKFIEVFRNNPCLWKQTCTEYKNQKSRMIAYKRLLKLSKQFEDKSTIHDVKKKLQSLRASYRKERRKVTASIHSASRQEDLYIPRLWYYKDLEFLNHHIEDNSGTSIMDLTSTIEIKQDTDEDDEECISTKSDISNPLSLDSAHDTWESPSASTSVPIDTQQPQEQNVINIESNNEMFKYIIRKLERDTDEFDIFGKSVAAELRNMNRQQRIIAKKLISDVLFHGQLEHLALEAQIQTNNFFTE